VPDLNTEELTLALAVVAGVALIAFLLALVLALRLRRMRRQYALLRGDKEDRDLVATLGGWAKKLDGMNRLVEELLSTQQQNTTDGRFALQKFHIVRYDAFEDMGGRLSFSAALLDDHGDGVVITSINGRTETRTYAKPVKALSSDHNLSEEEREAIAGAMASYGRGQERTAISN
jgi:hypothetical protein